MCPAHNRLMAEIDYGTRTLSRFGRSKVSASSPTDGFSFRTE
jgi:hypothetical protein